MQQVRNPRPTAVVRSWGEECTSLDHIIMLAARALDTQGLCMSVYATFGPRVSRITASRPGHYLPGIRAYMHRDCIYVCLYTLPSDLETHALLRLGPGTTGQVYVHTYIETVPPMQLLTWQSN